MNTETELQIELVEKDKFREWMSQLPDYIQYEINNAGFQLHHLIGKYNGFLDPDMEIQSLWAYVGLEIDELPNILTVYKQIINKV